MPAPDTATIETWVYAGKWVSNGRLRDRWVDPTGRDLIYAKFTGQVVGGLYSVTVDRTDKTLTVYGAAIYQHERMSDHEKMTSYIVDDMSQRTKHTQLRREKRDGEIDPLDDAMLPLLRYARACKTRPDKDALIATVLRRLTDAW